MASGRNGCIQMFVYYYANVERPLAEVEEGLEAILDRFQEFAGDAHRDGEAIAARLKVGAGRALAKEVHVRAWPLTRTKGVMTMKIAWEASGPAVLFPDLDADLVAAELAEDITQISLRGIYSPPLGPVGRALDKALLHRVAELTVQRFVDRIVTAIEERAARPEPA